MEPARQASRSPVQPYPKLPLPWDAADRVIRLVISSRHGGNLAAAAAERLGMLRCGASNETPKCETGRFLAWPVFLWFFPPMLRRTFALQLGLAADGPLQNRFLSCMQIILFAGKVVQSILSSMWDARCISPDPSASQRHRIMQCAREVMTPVELQTSHVATLDHPPTSGRQIIVLGHLSLWL